MWSFHFYEMWWNRAGRETHKVPGCEKPQKSVVQPTHDESWGNLMGEKQQGVRLIMILRRIILPLPPPTLTYGCSTSPTSAPSCGTCEAFSGTSCFLRRCLFLLNGMRFTDAAADGPAQGCAAASLTLPPNQFVSHYTAAFILSPPP